MVVPIIIYTGNEKWRTPKEQREKQIGNYVFENYRIDLEYNIIDINKLTNRVLLERDTLFSYMMYIEKSETKEELIKHMKCIKNKQKLEEITNIISYWLDKILEENTQEQLLEKIEQKEGEKNMSNLYDRLLEESRRDIKQGKRKAQKEIAKNMVKKNLEDKIILQTTRIKKEELEKIKSQLQIMD